MKLFRCVVLCILLSVPIRPVFAQETKTLANDITGSWLGVLDVGAVKLRLVFKISKTADGRWAALCDSPDQGAKDIPCTSVSWENDQIAIEMKDLMASFSGQLKENSTIIDGTFKQGGQSFPLVCKLVKADDPALINKARPQDPQKPYPYLEEEVSCHNKKANIILAGTLTLPQAAGPFPAVVLITGSGSQNRDEEIFNHRPFLVLADYLTRQGIAVLRLDDRGINKSGGKDKVATSTTVDFVDDINAAVEYLRTRQDIVADKIGLIGHSEGGCIAPMIAAQDKKIAFIAMMAGLGTTGFECLVTQQAKVLALAGLPAEDIDGYVKLQKALLQTIIAEKDNDLAIQKMQNIYKTIKAQMRQNAKKMLEALQTQPLDQEFKVLTAPWMRYFLSFDPAVYLRKVSCPVLAVNGDKDCQVSAKDNLQAIEKWLKAGGNKKFTVKELPNLNHLFQTAKTGNVSEYAQIDETIAPVALETIGAWIQAQIK
jgi:pimeloyl-ACP methyl ester carboxylesterase